MTDNAITSSDLNYLKLTLKEHSLLLRIVGQCKNCSNKFNQEQITGGEPDHQKETETPHHTKADDITGCSDL